MPGKQRTFMTTVPYHGPTGLEEMGSYVLLIATNPAFPP